MPGELCLAGSEGRRGSHGALQRGVIARWGTFQLVFFCIHHNLFIRSIMQTLKPGAARPNILRRASRTHSVAAMGFFNFGSLFSKEQCKLAPAQAPEGLKLATFAGEMGGLGEQKHGVSPRFALTLMCVHPCTVYGCVSHVDPCGGVSPGPSLCSTTRPQRPSQRLTCPASPLPSPLASLLLTPPPATLTCTLKNTGGCFWGIELAYQRVPGVVATTVGYTGGADKNPNYDSVCSGRSGHAEAIQCTYDPKQCSYGTAGAGHPGVGLTG